MLLGKLPAVRDERNIKFRAITVPEALPEPPFEYDVDMDNPRVFPLPLPKFANDQWGCCVAAARANQTLRFEKLEQGVVLDITDQDVLREYWKEQGDPEGKYRPDEGLVMLHSLKAWRDGWVIGDKTYSIYAFAEIDRYRIQEIKQAIWLLGGLQAGVVFRQEDMRQYDRGEIWTLTDKPGDFDGGHCMYVIGWTLTGPVFLTWGKRQVATWEWFLKRCDEVYGVVDAPDRFIDSPLDVQKMNNILNSVSKIPRPATVVGAGGWYPV